MHDDGTSVTKSTPGIGVFELQFIMGYEWSNAAEIFITPDPTITGLNW